MHAIRKEKSAQYCYNIAIANKTLMVFNYSDYLTIREGE